MDADTRNKVNELLGSMQNMHFPSTPVFSDSSKLKAISCTQENELEAICNLVEAHATTVRYIALERHNKAIATQRDNYNPTLCRNSIDFDCGVSTENKIKRTLGYLTEMPKEWAIVQLTSQYDTNENINIHYDKCYTNTIHITVLNCGVNQLPPFTMTLEPPVDVISGGIFAIQQEMYNIIRDNELHLKTFRDKYKASSHYLSDADKLVYVDDRRSLNNRLENLINEIQNKWFNAWRCLFLGKFVDENLEKYVVKIVDDQLKEYNYDSISEKNRLLLIYLVKGSGYLNLSSSKKALKYIFPRSEDRNIRLAFNKIMQSKEFNFVEQKRHPLILIIDVPLDPIPWEMIDVLQKHSVSRLPSLHFAYSLFKEHEKNIVNGFMEIYSTSNATYMLNPGLDLNTMQLRMHNFFKYWRPDWSGIVGVEPSEEVFLNTLTTSDLFIYCGHGSGTQFLRGEDIQRTKVNSIVFLFGCGSIKLSSVGTQAEVCSSYFNYLIASCPCVIGMLWIVTDFETDALATELLSQWIPSEAPDHWKLIAKDKWAIDGSIHVVNKQPNTSEVYPDEPELLKALANVKWNTAKYITRAACIARGLPVKIIV